MFRALIVSVLILAAAPSATAVTIDTVPVGNPGNVPDPMWLESIGPLGSVGYEYRIGTYEVTNDQYAEFLNAKAGSDPLGLYDAEMGSSLHGGITRDGSSPDFTYSVKPDMGNKPVNFVTFWDAARLANWMHNGQAGGDTETGSYTLGGVQNPTEAVVARTRIPGATWVLPTENEWNKAAYYDPRTEADGGPPGDDNYWLYPTMSDSAPTQATANSIGDISNGGPNVANYFGGANWNGSTLGNITTVGTAGLLSQSYYHTFDQAANVAEWSAPSIGNQFLFLGGAYSRDFFGHGTLLTATGRQASIVSLLGPTHSDSRVGFRLALVPEPSSLWLALIGLAAALLVAHRSTRFAHQPRKRRRCVAAGGSPPTRGP
jgi:formylglycine-generating enzyme required for sulfatase activity